MYPKFEKLMQERGLTIFQVSKDTGIPNSILYEWKSGRSEPKIDKIYTLAKYFGVPMEYFMEEN